MRITVKARTGARINKVQVESDGVYVVFTSAIPEYGKANEAVIALLADYFQVSKPCVTIVFGKTSREKIVEIIV